MLVASLLGVAAFFIARLIAYEGLMRLVYPSQATMEGLALLFACLAAVIVFVVSLARSFRVSSGWKFLINLVVIVIIVVASIAAVAIGALYLLQGGSG